VKKHQSYWFLLLALLVSGTLQAKVNSYIGAYANAGEWSLLPSESKTKPSLGGAGGVGFLYELQAGKLYQPTRFLLDVGIGVQGGATTFKQTDVLTQVLPNQVDLQGDLFDYVYEIRDRQDQYTNVAVQVPLMIGVQHHKFYMLAGVKVNYNVMTKSNAIGVLNTYGRYSDFDDFRNMPDYQFFTDRPLKNSSNPKLNLGVDASVEIGGRLGVITDAVGYDVPKRKIECRLAAFADYGILDIHKEVKGMKLLETPYLYDTRPASPNYVYNTTTMVDGVLLNDIMSTEGFAKAVNNFMIGLKFTVLFQLPEPGQCVICHDAYKNLYHPRSGRLKYEE